MMKPPPNDRQERVLAALAAYNLKHEGGKQYRANSPFRANSDSMALTVTLDDGVGGTWYDHAANPPRGGSLTELAAALGIDGNRRRVDSSKRAYHNWQEYAHAHGVYPPERLKAYRWQPTVHAKRPALRFWTDNGWRYRYLDGEKPHYRSPTGYKPCWYGVGASFLNKVLVERQPAVLCNGEISVVTATEHGLAAFCTTGGEKQRIPDDLLRKIDDLRDDTILIALDCDDTGRSAARGILTQLKAAGFSDVRAVDLGLTDGGDLADFCRLYGETTKERICKLPDLPPPDLADADAITPIPKGLPTSFVIGRGKTSVMLHAKHRFYLPSVEWVVPGEIPQRALTVVYGPSGVGKSFYIIDTALKVAQTSPVVYMALEGEGGVPSRVDAWCKHHQQDVGELVLNLGTVSFFDDADLDAFIINCQKVKPTLVVVDTLARSMTGADENSTRDMSKFTARCAKIMHALDCAVVLVHHTGKQGDYERGSSALRAAADSMIALVDDDDYILVKCAKTKDARPFETRDMRLLPVDVAGTDAHGEPLQTPVIVPADRYADPAILSLTVQQREVLTTMAQSVFEHGCTAKQLEAVVHDVKPRGLYRILTRLKDAGLVQQSAAREPYTITEAGRAMLES